MAKTLLVFDAHATLDAVVPSVPCAPVLLFPLTSADELTDELARRLTEAGCAVEVAPSAALINAAAERVRGPYLRLVAELPTRMARGGSGAANGGASHSDGHARDVRGRDLRELFALDGTASLWWLSLVAEKNTWKSDAFNALARLDAVMALLADGTAGIDRVAFAAADGRLARAVPRALAGRGVAYEALAVDRPASMKQRIWEGQSWMPLKHCLLTAYLALDERRRARVVRRRMAAARQAAAAPPAGDVSPLLFLTYYPNLDLKAALSGEYRDAYYPGLQQALERRGERVAWVGIHVDNNAIPFERSLEYAERFIAEGYDFHLVDEFITDADRLWAARAMLRATGRFMSVRSALRPAHVLPLRDALDGRPSDGKPASDRSAGGASTGGYPLYDVLRDDWYSSFVGASGYFGCLYYRAFTRLLDRVEPRACVYPCEMHAWERALISARDARASARGASAASPFALPTPHDGRSRSKVPMVGYQSGTVSPMLLNYSGDSLEVAGGGRYPLPKPEVVAVNGPHSYRLLKAAGWADDRLRTVEALRYEGLRDIEPPAAKENVVLLGFSISARESGAILAVAHRALGGAAALDRAGASPGGPRVLMRPHPFLRMADVLAAAGVKPAFELDQEPLAETLERARIAVVGESSVAIEALAHGCEVVIVETPEFIDMSPLRGVESEMIHAVGSPRELAEVVAAIRARPYDPERLAAVAREVVDDFFCLPPKAGEPALFLEAIYGDGSV